MAGKNAVIPINRVENLIVIIRDQKVMLDKDLAKLYGVTTGNLNLAVTRNIKRFPEDFMFRLTKQELSDLKLQFAISSWGGYTHSSAGVYGAGRGYAVQHSKERSGD